MLKPPTQTATQFLDELGRKCREFAFYLEKWFPRLPKYARKSDGEPLSRGELKRVVLDEIARIYAERAAKNGGKLNRELNEEDLTAKQLINAWSYHWAHLEGSTIQLLQEEGKVFEHEDFPDLDATTLENLKFGKTYQSIGTPKFKKFRERILKGNPKTGQPYDDPIDDLVFVDLCCQNPEEFAEKFRKRFSGYLRTILENSKINPAKVSDEEFTSCVDYAFMKAICRTFLGLAGLQHWCARAFITEVRRRMKSDRLRAVSFSTLTSGNGDNDERSFDPSIDSDCTDEDLEVVDKYVKLFKTSFCALPPELQLALNFRFTRIMTQESGRPITRVADFHEKDLAAAGLIFGLPPKAMKKSFDAHKSSIQKLIDCLNNDEIREVSLNAQRRLSANLHQIVSDAAQFHKSGASVSQ